MAENKYALNIEFLNPIYITSDIYEEEHVIHAPRECDHLLDIISRILRDNDDVLENTSYKIKNDLIHGIIIKFLELDEEQYNKINKYINKFNSISSNNIVKLIKINIVKLQIIGWSPSYIRTQKTTCNSMPQDIKNMIEQAKEILLNYDIDSELSIRDIKEERDIDPEIILTVVTISQEYNIDIDTIGEINSDFEKLTIDEIIIKLS